MSSQTPENELDVSQAQVQEPPHLTRRHFLVGMLVVAAGSLFAVDVLDTPSQSEVQAKAAAKERIDTAFTTAVANGMLKDWRNVSIWPGDAIIPNDVELYSTATLSSDSKIQWPKDRKQDHLEVQRPFMVRASALLNRVPAPESVGPEVIGFWLPGSNNPTFCDILAHPYQILLATNTNAPVYYQDRATLEVVGQTVLLQPAFTQSGLTWRILDAKRVLYNASEGFPEQSVMEPKVCGRSSWAGFEATATINQAFDTGNGNDPIQPPENHG